MSLKRGDFLCLPTQGGSSVSQISRRRLLQGLAGAAALSSASILTRPAYSAPVLGRRVYKAKAVHFNGLTLLRRTGLIGKPSGKYLASVWIKPYWVENQTGRVRACFFQANGTDAGTGNGSTVFHDEGFPNSLFLYARESNDNEFLWYRPDFQMPSGAWHHWLVNVDTTTNPIVKQFYLNDVPVIFATSFQNGVPPFTAFDILQETFYNSRLDRRTNPPIQDMADFWLGVVSRSIFRLWPIVENLSVSTRSRLSLASREKRPLERGRRFSFPAMLSNSQITVGPVDPLSW
jgi:hypothetical protein